MIDSTKPIRAACGLLAGLLAVALLGGCPAPDDGTKQVASNAVSPSNPSFAQTKVIYLPGDDEKLHPKKVSFKSLESQTRAGGNAAPALQEIIQGAPAYFPPKTKINSSQETEKHIAVDLNTNFADQDFWGVKGELTTELALYSIVNSASGDTRKPVLLTVEGKPMPNIGEFDVGDPIEPEPKMMAPSSTKANNSVSSTQANPSVSSTKPTANVSSTKAGSSASSTKATSTAAAR